MYRIYMNLLYNDVNSEWVVSRCVPRDVEFTVMQYATPLDLDTDSNQGFIDRRGNVHCYM